MNLFELSLQYDVRKLTEKDIEIILELSVENPLFFQFCPPQVTRKSIREDMNVLPPDVDRENKYYIGFFEKEKLVAVMDLILGYPERNAAFIGLFMMRKSKQGQGIGSSIVSDCAGLLRNQGYQKIRLAYAKGNPQSERFWKKNGFEHTGEEMEKDGYTAVLMERILTGGRADRAPHSCKLWRADR